MVKLRKMKTKFKGFYLILDMIWEKLIRESVDIEQKMYYGDKKRRIR